MSFYDDEAIPLIEKQFAETKPKPFIDEKTKLTVINKNKAALEATNFTVLLELEGNGSIDDTPGVDIVTVLDVSGSMGDNNKLQKMKNAMKFLIKKLSENHRLSVVTFSTTPNVQCSLRRMTEQCQKYIEGLVDDLQAGGGTNIAGGLRMALDVLNRRKVTRGRVPAIMLMSDGDQGPRYEDARNVTVGDFPVFTFGFGKGRDYNPEVLNTVARNSKGGTFSVADIDEISESNNLNIAFAQCLAGLLTVVVQDLQLTITKVKPDIAINGVSAGDYPLNKDDAKNITISFGHLYDGETRSVLVDLNLPIVTKETEYEVLEITYSYIYDEESFEAPVISVIVGRTRGLVDEEKQEVTTEKKRLGTIKKMQNATHLADNGKFDEAQNELKQAQQSLEMATHSFTIKALKSQVAQLLEVMKNEKIYKNKGQHIALAMLTSHHRQRLATIGDDNHTITKHSLYATSTMIALVEQAIKFFKNPNEPILLGTPDDVIPILGETEKSEDVPNYNSLTAANISQHIGTVIQALQAIQGLLNSSK